MKQEVQADQQLTFDRYCVDLANAQLWREQRAILLTAKAFAVLRHLIEHAGQLATKAESLISGLRWNASSRAEETKR